MSSQDRQDQLLEQLVAADDAASDMFFTASSMDGTTLFHQGLSSGHMEVGIGDVKALAARGLLAIMEYRAYGDVALVVAPAGSIYAEQRKTGTTPIEAERARADRAEEALRVQEKAAAARVTEEEERRKRLARRIAWLPAAGIALLLGYVLFQLTETAELRLVFGVLLAAGVAGSWVFEPTRAAGTRLLVPLLRWIHELT